jgi:tetratricopeptide (TPR) repeat protein
MQPSTSISATGPAAFGVIAERFRRAGQPDKAVALCREGLEKFPDHLSARVTLGWSLLDIGEHQEAFDQLKSVLKRAPDNLAAIRGLAELHERGIGLSFDPLSDEDQDMELDPVMPVMAVMPAMPAMAKEDELDPVMPALEPEVAEYAPALFEPAGDLDPIFEPEVLMESPALETIRPFEIEDVIDAGEPDTMFDLSGLLATNVIAMPEPPAPRKSVTVVEGAPLALREHADAGRADELSEWLARVRDRRTESMSQYMAG